MRGGYRVIAAALCAVLVGGVAACGEDEGKKNVVEGEPVELGALKFNVQLTRFLNPQDREDSEYLVGLPPIPQGKDYLAIFVEVSNESDDPVALPEAKDLKVVDTTGATYNPVASDSVFALPLGGTLGDGDNLPAPDTAAASGPTQGSIVLFLVDQGISENRPLELEIEADGEKGTVELDI
jgi:hypothetical protein